MPEGKQAVLLTPEQIRFLIENCEKNELFATNQLMRWSQMDASDVELVRDSFLKLDAIKNQFRALRRDLEAQFDA